MEVKKHSKFQRYVMPGLIFQSVVIASGYGTGAELNEYFFRYGRYFRWKEFGSKYP